MSDSIRNFFYGLLGITLGVVLFARPIFALVVIGFMLVAWVAVIQPPLLIIGYFFYAQFQEYVRYLFPAAISIGGNRFILAGSVKEILIFLALGSFLCRRSLFKGASQTGNITVYAVLSLLTWFFVNIFRNASPINGFWGFRNYFYVLGFYFVGYYLVSDRKTAVRIIAACLLSGAVLTAVALVQAFHDPGFLVSRGALMEVSGLALDPGELKNEVRITSLLSNPNLLGQYLVTVVLLAGSMWLYSKSRKNRLLMPALLVSSLVAIAYTLSRESWLAVASGMLLLGVAMVWRRRYFAFLALILGVFCILYFMPSSFYDRLHTLGMSGGGPRITVWNAVMGKASGNLVLGMGTGRIGAFGASNRVTLEGTAYSFIDSAYVRTLVEEGLVGMVLLLAVCFCFARDIFIVLRAGDADFPRSIVIGAMLVLLSILITSFFADSLFASPESGILWLLMGYIGRYRPQSP